MTTQLIIVSDLHTNSTVGLCAPGVELDDGGTYERSHGQRWLWSNWISFWDYASGLPGRKVVVLNGDLGEIDGKDRSWQIITHNPATALDNMLTVLKPALDTSEQVFVIRGTAAHVGKSSWLEEALARDLRAHEDKGAASHWHLKIEVEGVRMDIAHHASMGGLPWHRSTAANRLAARVQWEYWDRGVSPPHLTIRSHNHWYANSADNYKTQAVFTPCWTLKTEHAYRIGLENAKADIGGLIITCSDGRYTLDRIDYKPLRGSKEWTKV